MLFRKLIIPALLTILPLVGFAQVNDDFTDGDFTNNPTWSGDVTRFQVNGMNELWLNDPAPIANNTSYLSTPSQAINNGNWEVKVRMVFNTSSTNFSRVYLTSNNSNLNASLNGYFVQLGSTDDDICLFVQSGNTVTKIIDGPNGVLNRDPNIARIKVTRDNAGNWELLADTAGGTNYVSYGTTANTTHTTSLFMGVYCRYTSTRSDKFFFDDVLVTGTAATDNTKPAIASVTPLGGNLINVLFTEPVQVISAETEANYTVNNGLGNPTSAVVNGGNNALINLTMSGNVNPSTLYTLNVTGIQDFAGNVMNDTTISFAIVSAQPKDIVINEVFPDPSPVVGLPEIEFIELYNRTNLPINLQGWDLVVGSSVRVLPSVVIPADSFLVITGIGNEAAFGSGLNVLGITSFPSLTNSGAIITLQDTANIEIDKIQYALSWYNDPAKDDGGYTLERVNPNEFCGKGNNWAASNDPTGGTPGRQNSVFNTIIAPTTIRKINVVSPTQIDIIFNKEITTIGVNASNFTISNGIGNPTTVFFSSADTVKLGLGSVLNINQLYTLTFSGTVNDCGGNPVALPQTEDFIYYVPAEFDLVINEIMADESPVVGLPAAEYVEIYNRKNFRIPLQNYVLRIGTSSYTLNSGIIEPDSFVVLVRESLVPNFAGLNLPIVPVPGSPSYTNSGTTVTLLDPSGFQLHSVTYADTWYKNNAKRDGGWSLEQIDPTNPCAGISNWEASVSPLGGTPGATNSVKRSNPDTLAPQIVRSGVIAADSLLIYFDESLANAGLSVNDFSISNGVGLPLTVSAIAPLNQRVILKLSAPIVVGQSYWVRVSGVQDCSGNASTLDSIRVQIADTLAPQDIIINEVLFDPLGTDPDYVEIYNNSNKVIDLRGLRLATNEDTASTGFISSVREINNQSLLLFPGEYFVLTTNQTAVKNRYTTTSPNNFWNLASMPTYANTSGVVTLCTPGFTIIDQLAYNDGMHFKLLNSKDGVSLERIFFNEPTQSDRNWTSAAQTIGFGTPAYKNSQAGVVPSVAGDFVIEPDMVSPDNDGYQDFLNIKYTLADPGFIGTITIYEAGGRTVRKLIQSQLLAKEGVIIWDGLNEDGEKARTGPHIVVLEIVSPDGRTDTFKKVCVVATRM